MIKKDSSAKQFLRGLLAGRETLTAKALDVALVVDQGQTMLIHWSGRHKIMLGDGKGREISQESYEKIKAMEKAGRVSLFEIGVDEQQAGENWPAALELWNSFQP